MNAAERGKPELGISKLKIGNVSLNHLDTNGSILIKKAAQAQVEIQPAQSRFSAKDPTMHVSTTRGRRNREEERWGKKLKMQIMGGY
ncbi:hypothetical protein V6N12_024747 [Hibiscus sabdariffa]|uniref:Uncharacterized protein n=1 Tax=Hibiscus sabdariffa TaxID=183260 RepID=A0ABR2BF51_9ROSI